MKTRARRSTMSEIANDLDYRTAPTNPDPVQMAGWVASYRSGAVMYRKLIISAHLHLVASIAAGMARRYNRLHMVDELVGEANLHLVQAVEDAPQALHDDNITPYITSTVRHRLHDFISEDRIVFMPGRTFRHKVAEGEIGDGDALDRATIAVISITAVVEADKLGRSDGNADGEFYHVPYHNYHVPEAPPNDTSMEFEEALTLAIVDETERKVIDLRLEGYKYRDMEEVLGLKRSRISEIVGNVRRRFEAYA